MKSAIKINPQIFREYDIRGLVDRDLSPEFAYLLGRAYGDLACESGKSCIAIGHDCRLSSPIYVENLARGISEAGIEVVLTGMGPTPQLYYAVYSKYSDGGIQVTGSHNPSDMNGFKLCLGTEALASEQIQDLYRRVLKFNGQAASSPKNISSKKGNITEAPIRDQYIKMLIDNVKPHLGNRKLKIVVDAGNGVGGLVGPAVLTGLGVEVIELYCEPDGRFPNHHPDPTVLENIEELIATVKETKADFGIGWDGDADRIGVVDEKGQVIFGDMLLLIYARALLPQVPKATVIGDVKCSNRLFDDLSRRGANPIMWKTGHSLIKKKLKELGGELGGEMSGHIMFKNRYFGFDDALYCSARLAELMSQTDRPISTLLSDLKPSFTTPEIRVDCPEEIKFKIAEEAQSEFADFEVNTIDGARVTFPDGWGLVRASNTQPILVMRFEADSQEALKRIQDQMTGVVEKIKQRLSN